MRRTPLALTSLALTAALALAACSGSKDSSAGPSAGASASATAQTSAPGQVDCSSLTIDSDSASLPGVSGEAGTEPRLEWGGGEAPGNLTVKTLKQGDGAVVGESNAVKVSYAGWQWGSDKAFDSSYARGLPANFILSQVIPGWRCGLAGHKVGERVEMSIPANLAYGDDASSGQPTGALVFVVEIAEAFTPEQVAAGTADASLEGEQAVADRGISVTGALGAEPAVKVNPGAAEPTQPEVLVLAKGTGQQITKDTTLLAHMVYTAWDGSGGNSSWRDGQVQMISMAQAPSLAGLEGVPVGSRVVVLTPRSQDRTGQPVPSYAYVMDIGAAM